MTTLPQHWQELPLIEVVRAFVSGGTPSTKNVNHWSGDVPWTTSAPIKEGDVLLERAERRVSREGLENSASNIVPEGNILVGTRVGVGKAVVNSFDIAISQDLTGVLLDSTRTDATFLAYQFKAGRVQNYFAAHSRGTTIKGISRFDLERLPLQLPPLPEQRAVARVLQNVQKARESRRLELALELERKAALVERFFSQGIRGNDRKLTGVGEIPRDWVVLPLVEIATVERGKFTHRPRNDPRFYGGTVPFIQTGDVTAANGHIKRHSQTLNERGLSVSRVFPKGTIVITIAANIGFTAILDFDCAFPDSLIGITPRECIIAEFLNYYLATQQPEMDRKAPRGTQKNINIEFLNPWPVLVPPLEEQRVIAETLRMCDSKTERLQQEGALLDELFDAMLEELMSEQVSATPLIEEVEPR